MGDSDVNKTSTKKKFKLVYKIIAGVLSLVVSVVTLFAFLLFDPYEYQQVYKANNKNDVYDELAVLSSYDMTILERFSYEIDLTNLNELMNLSYLNHSGSKLSQFYMEETNEGYNFVFQAKLLFDMFKTRVVVRTSLSNDESGYIFKINSMNAGKLNVMNVIKGTFNDSFFNGIFKDMDLSIESDISSGRFTYSYENIIKDYRSRFDFKDEFFQALFNDCDAKVTSPFRVDSSVSSYKTNLKYVDPSPEFSDRTHVEMKGYKDGLAYLIQNNVSYRNISNQILKYFLKGYDELTSEEKSNIDKIDFSEFSISDNSSYKGIEKPKNSAEEVPSLVKGNFDVCDHSSYVSGSTYNVANVYESNINKTLRTSDALFRSTSLTCKTYASTFAITDFYSEIIDDHINFIYQIDLDGLKTNLILDFVQNDSSYESTYVASFNLDKIYYGEKQIKSDFISSITSLFNESLVSCSNNGYMSFNDESDVLTLNFKSFVECSSQSDYFLNYGKGVVESIGGHLQSTGYLAINFKVA